MAKKKPNRSRYDELHDKYHKILTTKAGTRYERLAALVFKALEEHNAVIHDMALTGENPDVKHQIDVTVDTAGAMRRIVIECKDFDIAGGKVGLGIIRNFRSVIEDTEADEGIVITCNGFTQVAQKYAPSKGIKLAVLRLFEMLTWMAGSRRSFSVSFSNGQPIRLRTCTSGSASAPGDAAELAAIGATHGVRDTDPVFFVRNRERRQFNEFLTARMNEADGAGRPQGHPHHYPGRGLAIRSIKPPIPFDGIVVEFEWTRNGMPSRWPRSVSPSCAFGVRCERHHHFRRPD